MGANCAYNGVMHSGRYWGWLSVVVAACSFDTSGVTGDASDHAPDASQADAVTADAEEPPDGSTVPDAVEPPDAQRPDASCEWTYSPQYFDPCASGNPVPKPPLVLGLSGTYHYDTDLGVLQSPAVVIIPTVDTIIDGARVMWVEGFAIAEGATLRVEGSRPLIVISTGSIAISGTLDASSYWDGIVARTGAGADPDDCPVSPPTSGLTCVQHGGSGGGAGAFGGDGGGGGEGGDTRDCEDGINVDGIPGGEGGVALGAAPSVLRGGCAGRDGAQNESGTVDRGRAGPGGGAVHLTARGSLVVGGVIQAGGAGGTAGLDNRSGGGGGGSGGFIGLEAHSIEIQQTGVVAANGGGGGGGCDNNPATSGESGLADDVAATGGAAQGSGGKGGDGGYRDSPAGEPGEPAERGGGGGGGGVGYIVFHSPTTPDVHGDAVVSPAQLTP